MKRTWKWLILPALCVALALCLALSASAEDGCELIEARLTVPEEGPLQAAVTLTANRACRVIVALHENGGRLVGLNFASADAAEGEQHVTVNLPRPEELKGVYIRAYMTEQVLPRPLAEPVRGCESGVFALLCEDGTLLFQSGAAPWPEGGVAGCWPVAPEGYEIYVYEYEEDWAPWLSDADSIVRAEIGDAISPVSTAGWFQGCVNLTEIAHLDRLDTSHVTSMGWMFYECKSLKALDLSGFDTSAVTEMSWMFKDCSSLTALDLKSFDTSNVTDMTRMFAFCSSLKALDLSGFDTSRVESMMYLFQGCNSLTSLDLSSFDTARVRDMQWMFGSCICLKTLDVSSFDTASATRMNGMFSGCISLTELDLSSFDTSRVTTMRGMFSGCTDLTALDLTSFNTALVTDMGGMFNECSSLTELDLSSFDTSRVTEMDKMFHECEKLPVLDLHSFNTSRVETMLWMFSNCDCLTTIYASEAFDTGALKESENLFDCCTALVGGNGTAYVFAQVGAEYARIDAPGAPGYFTAK